MLPSPPPKIRDKIANKGYDRYIELKNNYQIGDQRFERHQPPQLSSNGDEAGEGQMNRFQ